MSNRRSRPELLHHVTSGLCWLATSNAPVHVRLVYAELQVRLALSEPQSWPSERLDTRARDACEEIRTHRDDILRLRGKGIRKRTERLLHELFDIMIAVQQAIGAAIAMRPESLVQQERAKA